MKLHKLSSQPCAMLKSIRNKGTLIDPMYIMPKSNKMETQINMI